MRLDRNLTPDATGKYALLKLRDRTRAIAVEPKIEDAIRLLNRHGLIHWGGEHGEQFFVMKYKDKFAAPALGAYAQAVLTEAAKDGGNDDLFEFYKDIITEYAIALRCGNKIPD